MAAMSDIRRRNTLRHGGYDYTSAGAYFVTVCAHQRLAVFGRVEDGAMTLNSLGCIADRCWAEFAERHPEVRVEAHVIMPNHAHVLIWIGGGPSAADAAPPELPRRFGDAAAGSLSVLIGAYKSAVTQRAVHRGLVPAPPIWQRSFHDRIVRNNRVVAK